MKKIIILLAIVLGSTTMASAQHCDKQCDKHKAESKTGWAEKKTNDMVALYNLNDKQSAQLLELNKEYADKLQPMRRGGHHHPHAAAPKPGEKKDCCKDDKANKPAEKACCKDDKANKPAEKACCKDDKANKPAEKACCKDGKPENHKHGNAKPAVAPEQMKQVKSEYDAKLKKIMTSKQYKQYQKDQND